MEGQVMKALLKKIVAALFKKDEPQMGTIDFETGKVIW